MIVNDSPTYRLGSGPCQLEDVVSPGSLMLGALRNRALAHVPFGTTWVQWDDDGKELGVTNGGKDGL